MLISDLVQAARFTVSRLDDPTVPDEQVVIILRQAFRVISARTGIKFTVLGSTWDTWQVTSPEMTDALVAIITIQSKQLLHSSSITIKNKVGPITVEYDPRLWDREEEFLEDLIDAYAADNGISLPSGFTAVSMNEYDIILNPDVVLNTIEGAQLGNIYNEFWK